MFYEPKPPIFSGYVISSLVQFSFVNKCLGRDTTIILDEITSDKIERLLARNQTMNNPNGRIIL